MGEASNNRNFVQGDQYNAARDQFIGNQNVIVTTIEAERAYDVRGLPNPYLGLRSYTYSDRAIFAGRERYVSAVLPLVIANDAAPLLFITGASGSGKSSFAQAGLVPAVQAYHAQRNINVRYAVFRPATQPLTALADALIQLGLASSLTRDVQAQIATPSDFATFVAAHTDANQRNLLLIDQFEEVFSQSQPQQRDSFLALLENLPPPDQLRTHIVATMRVDYLPTLFAHKSLYDTAKLGIDLRAMTVDELKEAIQRPIQQLYPDKRFEAELVDRLAADAAEDASYLPLLQVTLAQLWKDGSLKLAAYRNLTASIQEQAEDVYNYADYAGAMQQPRPDADKAMLLQIMLDLVQVSPDKDFADIRRPRERRELVKGNPTHERLLDDLLTARLLSARAGVNPSDVTIDIIHESLIKNWARLQTAIKEQRQQLESRERFERALDEWEASGRNDDYLLIGLRLAEAKELTEADDVAMQAVTAREFVERSTATQQAEQQRQLKLAQDVAAAAQREATATRSRNSILRRAIAGAGLLLAIAVVTSIFALSNADTAHTEQLKSKAAAQTAVINEQNAVSAKQTQEAETNRANVENQRANHNLQVSESQRLATTASSELAQGNTRTALLLGYEAYARDDNVLSGSVIRAALGQALGAQAVISNVEYSLVSPDTQRIVARSNGKVGLWDSQGKQLAVLANTPPNAPGSGVLQFSSDSNLLFIANEGQAAKLWNRNGNLLADFSAINSTVLSVQFSPDNQSLLIGKNDRTISLWNLQGQPLFTLKTNADIASFSPDAQYLFASIYSDTAKYTQIWSIKGNPLITVIGDMPQFSPDSQMLITHTDINTRIGGQVLHWWNLQGDAIASQTYSGTNVDIIFSPDSSRLLVAKQNATLELYNSSGKLVSQMQGSGAAISAAFSPDSNYVLVGMEGGIAQLWSKEGKLVATMRHQRSGASEISKVLFSPDGRRLLTIARKDSANSPAFSQTEFSAKLWSLGGALLANLQHDEEVDDATFSPDGQYIITEVLNGAVRRWDLSTLPLFNFYSSGQLRYSPDGRYLLKQENNPDGSTDRAELWSSDGQLIAPLTYGYLLDGDTFSPDSTRLITTNDSGYSIYLWDNHGNLIKNIAADNTQIWSVKFLPDSSAVVIASIDGAQLYDRNGKLLTALKGSYSAFIERNSQHFLTLADNAAWLWSRDGKLVATLDHPKLNFAALAPDGSFALTSDAQGQIKLWDANGKLITTLVVSGDASAYYAIDIVIAPDSQHFAAAGSSVANKGVAISNTLALWDKSGKQVTSASLEAGTNVLSFSPDGHRLLFGNRKVAWLLDDNGKQLATLDYSGQDDNRAADAINLKFSPDNQHIVAAGASGALQIWDRDGKLIRQLQGQTGLINDLTFSPDSNYLATTSSDGTVRLWYTYTTALAQFDAAHAQFSPDSKRIFLTSGANQSSVIRDYPLLRDDTLRIAACRVERGLNAQERTQFAITEPQFDISKRICPPPLDWQKLHPPKQPSG